MAAGLRSRSERSLNGRRYHAEVGEESQARGPSPQEGRGLPQAQHSTAQHSTAQSARTNSPSKYLYMPITVRQRKQADREHPRYCSTTSTAQRSAISPHTAAKQARDDQSATTQASRQSWRETEHVCLLPYTRYTAR